MRRSVLSLLFAQALLAQPPSAAEVRQDMGIPSADTVRGQRDAVGYATTAAQMAQVWALSAVGPEPEGFGGKAAPSAPGALCAHDDYVLAGRIYRRVLPHITARTIILVGVFHKWRRFGAQDTLVLDSYRTWRTPDGPLPVSPLREELIQALPPQDVRVDDAAHDSEHSLEAVAYWLKHQRPDVEILPVILPMASFPRLEALADHTGKALSVALAHRGWRLGKDVAVVISSDGVHYGEDFKYVPDGTGGVDAFQKAAQEERALMKGPLTGPVDATRAKAFFEACVDPQDPGTYRRTWCGRFAVPFGMLLLEHLARAQGLASPQGCPVALGFSVDTPELPLRALGVSTLSPANLYHFVGHPGVVFVPGTPNP